MGVHLRICVKWRVTPHRLGSLHTHNCICHYPKVHTGSLNLSAQRHSHTQRTTVHRPDCKVGAENVTTSVLFHTGRTTSGSISLHMHSSVHYRHICNDDVSSRLEGLRTRNRFEHPDSTYRDPLLDAPMTSLSTNTTYQNWHCAYCHGDLAAATTVIWDASFTCYGSDPPTALSDETTAEHIHVSFNPLTSEWNLHTSLRTCGMNSTKSTLWYIQRSTDNNKQETHSYCFLTFTGLAMELPKCWCNAFEISRCSDS